jgi:hypothetical protein
VVDIPCIAMRVGAVPGAWCAWCVAATSTLGCSTSPERLCDHVVEMARKQFGDLEDDKLRDQALKTCVEEKRALKANDRKKYDCFADCVMDVSLLAEAADCETKCGIPPKKPAVEEPPPEGIPGLWTDPYADATGADVAADGKSQ